MLRLITCFAALWLTFSSPLGAQSLRVGTFDVDATPEVGSPLAYDPMREATGRLSCRGMVIDVGEKPIVLCAIDWLGVANEAHQLFRQRLAEAVDTSVDRVVVHAIHQHDAPRCDLSAAELLSEHGIAAAHYDVPFIHSVFDRAASAAREALAAAEEVIRLQSGSAEVKDVASNRRMIGPDGKVHTTRYTACKDPAVRALPIGVIDPTLKLLAFEGEEGTLAVLTFYATHPQSYYRTGQANPDFPGMARDARQQASGLFHLHFNGAGGNIGAGKFNDGSHENRQVLAGRVADAMLQAWENRQSEPITAESVEWATAETDIPVADHLSEKSLRATMADTALSQHVRAQAAAKLGFFLRRQQGLPISIARLKLSKHYILFMPGELFVEYQLAAQAMKPEANVMMAAYGEYGTGYIGTRIAYPQGGYEVSPEASNVSPRVEEELLEAMRTLLGVPQSGVRASDFTDTTGPALQAQQPTPQLESQSR